MLDLVDQCLQIATVLVSLNTVMMVHAWQVKNVEAVMLSPKASD